MTARALSAAHARRFLVRRQLLAPPRALAASPESVLVVARRLGALQFDPLEVPGARNHDLVLHARVGRYRRAWCDRWLYGPPAERRLFEAYNKSLNILPMEELPWHRLAWDRAAARLEGRILGPRADTVTSVLARLRDEGPLSTADFTKHHGEAIDWYWAPTTEGRAVLEALFETGRVAIARREGNRRWYDLAERLLPADLLASRVAPDEARRHRVLSRHRAVGLLGAGGAAEITTGVGTAAEREAALAKLVDDGALVPVTVEAVRGLRYVLAEDLALLDAARDEGAAAPPEVSFIAPLDPLIWDRKLVKTLFGFEYTWEVYTPVEKRRHGYYVLPVLYGDRLVGRIEPRMDRASRALSIAGLSFEPGFDPLGDGGFVPALARALGAYREFVGADRVAWPRARVAAAIGRAVRAVVT